MKVWNRLETGWLTLVSTRVREGNYRDGGD